MIQKRRNFFINFIFSPKIFFLVGIIIVIAISFPLSKNISKKYKIDKEILELEEEIKTLEGANSDFKKMITYLESDYFVEEQARLNLGLKKEGEEVIVIEDGGEALRQDKISLTNNLNTDKNFIPFVWWSYFFKK